MRTTLLAALAGATALGGLLLACSSSPSSSEETTEGGDAGLDPINSSSSSSGSTSSSSGSTSSSSSSGSSGDPDGGGGGGGDGGGGGGGDGGGGGGGGGDAGVGTLCNAQTQKEAEPNDAQGTATAITTGMCGVLPTGSDVDFATFTLPANATSFNFGTQVTKPQVDFFLLVDAQRVPISGGSLPFEPGKKYYIEVRNKQNSSDDYRVTVNIKL